MSDLRKQEYPYGYWGLKLYSIFETFAKEYIDQYWPTDASVTADAELRWFFDQYSRLLPEICRYAVSWHISSRFPVVSPVASALCHGSKAEVNTLLLAMSPHKKSLSHS